MQAAPSRSDFQRRTVKNVYFQASFQDSDNPAVLIQRALRSYLKRKRQTTAKSAKDIQKLRSELQKEIDGLEVENLHNMVDSISCSVQDTPVDVKCLYLTNERATKVEMGKMPSVRKELGIEDPKMVMRIWPCHFGGVHKRVFPYFCDNRHNDGKPGQGRFPMKDVPEPSLEAQQAAEHQLLLLAKEVLLDVAYKNKALVIGSDTCALTAAFVRVCAPIQRSMGKDCPFRLLIFANAHYYELTSKLKEPDPTKVAYHVRRECKAWRGAADKMNMEGVLKGKFGEDRAYWPREDLPLGTYSVVMFESAETNGSSFRLALETASNFQNDFIASLSQELPVIALQTYGTNKMDTMPALAEHVNRELPVMLLDSRDRPIITRSRGGGADTAAVVREFRQRMGDVMRFARSLHESEDETKWNPRTDQYFTSMMAYVKACLDAFIAPEASSASEDPADDGGDSQLWLWEAIEKRGRARADRQLEGDREGPETGEKRRANREKELRRELVMAATNIVMEYCGGELEWESNLLHERCEKAIQHMEGTQDWQEMKALVEGRGPDDVVERLERRQVCTRMDIEDWWCRIRGCCFHSFNDARDFERDNKWLSVKTVPPSIKGTVVFEVDIDKAPKDPGDFEAEKLKLLNLLNSHLSIGKGFDEKSKTKKAVKSDQGMWLAIYDILNSKNVHTGNIHQWRGVHRKLFSVSQIDRLPRQNTQEALVLLRTAWTIVDIYNHQAFRYKVWARLSHFLLLLLGVLMVIFTTLNVRFPGHFSQTEQRSVLLSLALTSSFVTGFAAIVDPGRKWIQLRNSAYSLEAEIWKFRARAGNYQSPTTTGLGRSQSERKAEETLQEAILQIQGRVRLATGLKETSFYSLTVTADNLEARPPDAAEERPLLDDPDEQGAGQDAADRDAKDEKHARRRWEELGLRRKHNQHGQFRHPGAKDLDKPSRVFDNHHSPAKPEDYIRWRLVPKMDFYKRRIPRYAFLRRFFQATLLMAALASSLFATLQMPFATAVTIAVATAVASGQDILDVGMKLQRYSSIANSFASILSSWQALQEVDKQDVKHVTSLVNQTEALLTSERDAWMGNADKTKRVEGGGASGKKAGGEAKK